MAKHRAISKDYMTVGEVAKKIGVTVRTLQYYDKEGLLSPSAESEGGRRLYTDKDLVTVSYTHLITVISGTVTSIAPDNYPAPRSPSARPIAAFPVPSRVWALPTGTHRLSEVSD